MGEFGKGGNGSGSFDILDPSRKGQFMIALRKTYAPGSCEYETGYKEIRWDVSG